MHILNPASFVVVCQIGTCVTMNGHPQPRIIWFKDNQPLPEVKDRRESMVLCVKCNIRHDAQGRSYGEGKFMPDPAHIFLDHWLKKCIIKKSQKMRGRIQFKYIFTKKNNCLLFWVGPDCVTLTLNHILSWFLTRSSHLVGTYMIPSVVKEASGLFTIKSTLYMQPTKADKDSVFRCTVEYIMPGDQIKQNKSDTINLNLNCEWKREDWLTQLKQSCKHLWHFHPCTAKIK